LYPPDVTSVPPVAVNGAAGVALVDAEDVLDEIPLLAFALTVNVYEVPFVNPVTRIGLDEPVAVILPGLDVTVYVTVPLPT
jgi:hypothetical protein